MRSMFIPHCSSLPVPAAAAGRGEAPRASVEVGPGEKQPGSDQSRGFRAGGPLGMSSCLLCPAPNRRKAEAVRDHQAEQSHETPFATVLMTILNLPAFSFEANQSNSFGKVLIWFEAIVKLDSHLDR